MMFKGFVYIYTIGCQMNTYDTEKLFTMLGVLGYEKTDIIDTADIIICNTCSIREKAQEKAFSFLGRMAGKKKKKPGLITIMTGCVAQQEGEGAFKRIPQLDIVLGTRAFSRLPGHISKIREGRHQIVDIDDSPAIFEAMPDASCLDEKKISRFVTIMQGCDNYCTYCVVPHVRGRERSRTPESIVEEITLLAESGVREVTLLGQNVNSYGQKEGIVTFPELLRRVSDVRGIDRIRFATSHPKDLSDELIEAIRDIDKVCNHVHLPVQSGSDRILEKMNRRYTREKYFERIDRLRRECPGIGVSSDMIVGFPSETREDFDLTLDLVRRIEFDGLFAFAYSDRPNAPAAAFKNKLDEAEKMDRLNELLALQETITLKKNQALVGTRQEVLVEGESQKSRSGLSETEASMPQLTGRTQSSKIVHFCSDSSVAGDIVDITIEHAYPHSLWGSIHRS